MKYKVSSPFTVPMLLLKPVYTSVHGVTKKAYTSPESSACFFGSFKTFGGTENIRDGVLTLIDTAKIDCWYNPEITADCRIYLPSSGDTYEIIGEPENIEQRNQYLSFKVRKVGGKA